MKQDIQTAFKSYMELQRDKNNENSHEKDEWEDFHYYEINTHYKISTPYVATVIKQCCIDTKLGIQPKKHNKEPRSESRALLGKKYFVRDDFSLRSLQDQKHP